MLRNRAPGVVPARFYINYKDKESTNEHHYPPLVYTPFCIHRL
jgi:hypothetical protein